MLVRKQNGIALITAMIITTIAVSLAAMVMYRQQIQIRLSSNIGHLEQSYLYANGMEDWAGTILEKSYVDHPDYDSLLDDWYSDSALVLPITGGLMTGKLYDLQARINLNSIIETKQGTTTGKVGIGSSIPSDNDEGSTEKTDNTGEQGAKTKTPTIADTTRKRLEGIIRQIDPFQDIISPEKFTDILKDWIDKDQTNGNKDPEGEAIGDGAESSYYQSLDQAYYSADTELVSPTELRLLKDMDEKIFNELAKYTSTLPIENITPINVNTASETVLRAIGFTPTEIENILDARKDEPFESMDEFRAVPLIESALDSNTGTIDSGNLDVNSNYFLLQGKVEINNARLFINSILERKGGQVSVIMRDFSNPETITKAID